MWQKNSGRLKEAIDEHIGSLNKTTYKARDWALIEQLSHNADVFAAFKNHNEQKELVSLLKDETGKTRQFNEFKKAAAPITERYNKNWLRTEYDQARSSAEMAKKWNGFKEDKDLYPNLEYVAVMDSQTRSSHRDLNGTIRPLNDPFWDSHYPPNGWGCRCDAVQTDKPANQPPEDIDPGPGFDVNPGKSGKLFSDSAGYYDLPDDEISKVQGMADDLIQATMIRQAVTELKEKFVRTGSKKMGFNKKGIEETAARNTPGKAPKALALLYNKDNIQRLIEAGKHSVEGNRHTWKGEDNGLNFFIEATENDRGDLDFTTIEID